MLELADYLFYILAIFSFAAAVGVVTCQNPIYSALYLALSMIGLAGLFVSLDAVFVAAVQLIVYAGAVMVLFVMVLMLFDLKHDMETYSKGLISGFLKLASAGMLLGLIVGPILMSAEVVLGPNAKLPVTEVGQDVTKLLATTLFTKYLFGFEVIGFLLLVIAIGAVTLSRISGGTHHVE